jgi:hypothetical protein
LVQHHRIFDDAADKNALRTTTKHFNESFMRPYFAVLYDSFLESVKSKVLWILLGAWTLVLAGLFPLSLTSGESYKIAQEFVDELSIVVEAKARQ